jgi:hypothetical protein
MVDRQRRFFHLCQSVCSYKMIARMGWNFFQAANSN